MTELEFNVDAEFAPMMRELGLDADTVFTDPRIKVWRSLPDRENATLDYQRSNGKSNRLHIKRYPSPFGFMARQEIEGFNLLKHAGVPAAPIIASGFSADGSSFIILEDLAGYMPADKLLGKGFPFEHLLNATADLAAKLHNHRLHHRDLYLCHFMIKSERDYVDARLIDMTRVSRLDSVLTRRRWIIKDLGQFWYSTQGVGVTDDQRNQWLERYCRQRQTSPMKFIAAIQRKAAAIARHDVKLKEKQPSRNVSIDTNPS